MTIKHFQVRRFGKTWSCISWGQTNHMPNQKLGISKAIFDLGLHRTVDWQSGRTTSRASFLSNVYTIHLSQVFIWIIMVGRGRYPSHLTLWVPHTHHEPKGILSTTADDKTEQESHRPDGTVAQLLLIKWSQEEFNADPNHRGTPTTRKKWKMWLRWWWQLWGWEKHLWCYSTSNMHVC